VSNVTSANDAARPVPGKRHHRLSACERRLRRRDPSTALVREQQIPQLEPEQ
jgi:hypothetical protein